MPKNKKPVKGKWDHVKLDIPTIEGELNKIIHYAVAIDKGAIDRSINIDIDYDEMYKSVENLYMLLRLDLLAQDNKARAQKVREQVDYNQKAREA